MPRVRVHQHVNPLAKYYRELPIEPLDLSHIFANPDLPLHLDIGCGRGRFLLEMAETQSDWNFLGVEIREPLVIEANEISDSRKLKNLRYEFCNAAIDLDILLENLPKNTLRYVTIQFPDPWFKKRHAKRRMVRDKLVETVTEHLSQTGMLLTQTDVEFLGEEISELFQQHGLKKFDIEKNPMPVKTEREKSVEARNLAIYRSLFKKKKEKRK